MINQDFYGPIQEIKGPFKYTFTETLTPKIVDDTIQLIDDNDIIKATISHQNEGSVIVNGQLFYFKNGKILLKAFW